MFGYSWGPILIILLIVLILWGPKRLPDLAESVGKAIKSFKQAHDEPDSMVTKGENPTGTASTASQVATCPQCHKELSGDFAFCPHCGNPITKA